MPIQRKRDHPRYFVQKSSKLYWPKDPKNDVVLGPALGTEHLPIMGYRRDAVMAGGGKRYIYNPVFGAPSATAGLREDDEWFYIPREDSEMAMVPYGTDFREFDGAFAPRSPSIPGSPRSPFAQYPAATAPWTPQPQGFPGYQMTAYGQHPIAAAYPAVQPQRHAFQRHPMAPHGQYPVPAMAQQPTVEEMFQNIHISDRAQSVRIEIPGPYGITKLEIENQARHRSGHHHHRRRHRRDHSHSRSRSRKPESKHSEHTEEALSISDKVSSKMSKVKDWLGGPSSTKTPSEKGSQHPPSSHHSSAHVHEYEMSGALPAQSPFAQPPPRSSSHHTTPSIRSHRPTPSLHSHHPSNFAPEPVVHSTPRRQFPIGHPATLTQPRQPFPEGPGPGSQSSPPLDLFTERLSSEYDINSMRAEAASIQHPPPPAPGVPPHGNRIDGYGGYGWDEGHRYPDEYFPGT